MSAKEFDALLALLALLDWLHASRPMLATGKTAACAMTFMADMLMLDIAGNYWTSVDRYRVQQICRVCREGTLELTGKSL